MEIVGGSTKDDSENISSLPAKVMSDLSNSGILNEEFNFLPLLINILQDIVPKSDSSLPQTRIGDISSAAVALKEKFDQAFRVVESLPGIERSLAKQSEEIEMARFSLQRKRYMAKLYKENLFSGSLQSLEAGPISTKKIKTSLENFGMDKTVDDTIVDSP